MNTYQLTSQTTTSGWHSFLDVNAQNEFNMTPAQVAVQAGNLEEFIAITTDPAFDVTKMGTLAVFFAICKENDPIAYDKLHTYFRQVFLSVYEHNASQGRWAKRSIQ